MKTNAAGRYTRLSTETINCNICNKNDYDILFTKNSLSVVRCRYCGLKYTNPRLTEKELINLYSPKGKIKIDETFLKKIERFAAKRFSEILRYKKRGRLLEIGCAYGYFLNEAKKQGFEVYGVELSKQSISIAKKRYGIYKIFNGKLENLKTKDRFDAIALYHSLEHLPDPQRNLLIINKLLKKN